jgi:hypothetical protein
VPALALWGTICAQRGDLEGLVQGYAQALAYALAIHPKLVLDTLGQVRDTAGGLAEARNLEALFVLGAVLSQVVDGTKDLPEEMEPVAALARAVFTVLALLGASEEQPDAGAQARTLAAKIDAATEGTWKMEGLVESVRREA